VSPGRYDLKQAFKVNCPNKDKNGVWIRRDIVTLKDPGVQRVYPPWAEWPVLRRSTWRMAKGGGNFSLGNEKVHDKKEREIRG